MAGGPGTVRLHFSWAAESAQLLASTLEFTVFCVVFGDIYRLFFAIPPATAFSRQAR